MVGTRYSEARTLARGLRRLPGEGHADFKAKVNVLRDHFEQFNVDVSELCQWIMGLRPGGKRGSPATEGFWNFFLEPEAFLPEEADPDATRLAAFDCIAGSTAETVHPEMVFPAGVLDSIAAVRDLKPTKSFTNLAERLRGLNRGHRQVLLKAAAEWVVARYLRGFQNWVRQHEEWAKEKSEWETNHPELTESIQLEFNEIFKQLGIRDKRPRLCSWERMRALKDDCEYAGERIRVGGSWANHGSLCIKYKEFFDKYSREPGRDSKSQSSFKRYFAENAADYLELLGKRRNAPKKTVMDEFLRTHRQARWFPQAWATYLRSLGIAEDTLLKYGSLPHCVKFTPGQKCEHNPHTDKCTQYGAILEKRPELQKTEGLYRQWRRDYLSGPHKPSFVYPSKAGLPMPKIFGQGFFQPDFEKSELRLRLEGMSEGEFMAVGFEPWPKDYRPQPKQTAVTSVHISFIGTRARAGFHFDTPHRQSRFGVTQDDIDQLRSQVYPRRAQDQIFLDKARELLLNSFEADPQRDIRLLAVDLGTASGSAAFFEGKDFKEAHALKVLKIDRLYDALPKTDEDAKEDKSKVEKKKKRGLSRDHLARHLESWADGSSKIAKKRETEQAVLGDHDMRRLSLHTRGMIRDWVRLNTSQIMETAQQNDVDLIVFESMRGFRAPGYDVLDQDKKRRLAFFAYGRIRRKTAEKAVERGMRVVTVPYLLSSQFCAKCGRKQENRPKWERNKRKLLFKCEFEDCDHEVNSDENAARVLGRVFWGEVLLPTELPDRS